MKPGAYYFKRYARKTCAGTDIQQASAASYHLGDGQRINKVLDNYFVQLLDRCKIDLLTPLSELLGKELEFGKATLINCKAQLSESFLHECIDIPARAVFPLINIVRTAIAAGVIPGIRVACPRVSGRKRSSFSLTS